MLIFILVCQISNRNYFGTSGESLAAYKWYVRALGGGVPAIINDLEQVQELDYSLDAE